MEYNFVIGDKICWAGTVYEIIGISAINQFTLIETKNKAAGFKLRKDYEREYDGLSQKEYWSEKDYKINWDKFLTGKYYIWLPKKEVIAAKPLEIIIFKMRQEYGSII